MKKIYLLFVLPLGFMLGCRPALEWDDASLTIPGDQSKQVAKSKIGESKYDFSAYVNEVRGGCVLVTVQAAWVEACRRQASEIQELLKAKKDLHVVVLEFPSRHASIHVSDDEDRYAVKRESGVLQSVRVLPTTWVLDPSGKLVNEYHGVVDAGVLQRSISNVID